MMKKANNRTILFLGLLFIVVAFVCIVGVFYRIINEHQLATKEVEDIKEEIVAIDAQRTAAERQVQELAKRVGKEIELEHLIKMAEEEYGEQEREREEGDHWVDRDGDSWMITLGALNNIDEGSRLRVLDDRDQQIGVVVAEDVLDVVSYVYPLENRGQYRDDIYQVVVE